MLNLFTFSRIVLICLFPILFIIPGCGGGGGDDGGGGTPAPTVPTVVNYSVGASAKTSLLSGASASGMTFTINAVDLVGTYNRSTGATTLSENKGISFTFNQRPPALGNGALTIALTTLAGSTAQWLSGENPTAGSFQITVVSGYTIGTITVQVNNTRPGGAGVNIYDGSTLMSSLAWDGFKNAQDTSTFDYEVLPSLAYNSLQTVYRYLSQAYTMLEVVMQNQNTLEQGMITATKTSLNAGLPASMSAQWGDANGNGGIDPGDNFLTRFSNWWVDVSGSNQDYIYNGRLLWLSYWEGTNSSGTFVGGDFQFGIPGDEFFEQEVNGGLPDAGTKITMSNSGFLFLLSW
jgi:hypothetical protein